MYQVYCDGQLLHDPRMQEYQLVSPVLNLELNKTGNFTFTQYPDHPMAGKIQKLKSIIEVKKDGAVLFRGRPLSSKEGFYRQQDYTCEGELAFLLDSRVRPFEMAGGVTELFLYLINQHNEQVDEYKQFKVGTVTVTDPNDYINRSNITYETTLDILNTRLLDTLGGYLWVRHEADGVYLDYLADFPYMSTQRITFVENLLDYACTRDGSEIATALIPLGARLEDKEGNQTDERLTITEVNGGKDYVYDEAAVERYGWIFITQTWDDVTQAGNLKQKGLEALNEKIKTVETIEMTAADLSQMDKSFDDFRVCQYVFVDSPPHGVENEKFLVTKMSLNLSDPSQNKLIFGRVQSTFTQENNHTGQTVGDLVNRTEKIEKNYVTTSVMQQAVNSATNWITNGKGYVVISKNAAGQATEILVMDTPDITTAQKVWRFNNGGLGYSSTGYNGPYTTAITQDGHIVANFIDVGELTANIIKSGVLQSVEGNTSFNLDTGDLISDYNGSQVRLRSTKGSALLLIEQGKEVGSFFIINAGGENAKSQINADNYCFGAYNPEGSVYFAYTNSLGETSLRSDVVWANSHIVLGKYKMLEVNEKGESVANITNFTTTNLTALNGTRTNLYWEEITLDDGRKTHVLCGWDEVT